jgi:hypothetical protein
MDAEVYGNWLSDSGRWDWWFTGTFHYDASMNTARNAVDRLTDHFEPSRAAFAVESSNEWWKEGLGSNVHVHALLEVGEDGPSPWEAEEWWEGRYGWALSTEYAPSKGAAHYVSEYCMKDLLEQEASWGLYTGGQKPSEVLPF